MIPYGRQSIDKSDINAVANVLRSDWLTQGPTVKSFEDALADYCGAKYAVVTSNGTSGLHLAYLAAGLSKGDEVITTPNTFVATSNMVLSVGARPVFCDIRLDTFNIDERKIESLIRPKTKAIVPVHFAGHSCEMDTILKIARKHKLVVIEDACHAIGAEYKNKKIGSISDMTVFSFHPVKPITTGEGGAVLTNNKKYYEHLLHFRSHGISKDENGFNVMSGLGHNYRMTDMQAALGESQLKKLDRFIKKRHEVVSWYEKMLGEVNEIILPKELPNNYHGWHIYVIRVKDQETKLPLYKHLLQNGVGVNFHYPAVYSHPYYRAHGYKNIQLNNADTYHDSCITFPCHTGLVKSDIKYIARLVTDFFENGNR
jgi:UDP-4-amino-4,6-dideoxy-N-acetyl-beta-L-altrosamine transaminase